MSYRRLDRLQMSQFTRRRDTSNLQDTILDGIDIQLDRMENRLDHIRELLIERRLYIDYHEYRDVMDSRWDSISAFERGKTELYRYLNDLKLGLEALATDIQYPQESELTNTLQTRDDDLESRIYS